MEKNKIKIKSKILIFVKSLLLLFLFSAVLFSFYKLYVWFSDSRQISNEIEEIDNVVKPIELELNGTDESINPPSNENSPYWKYMRMPLIDVDLYELKKINSETKGWIQVGGTNINYPFVQHEDNIYYLTHSFNKKSNNAGWVFLDYRNDIESIDRNNIIYAHGRINSVLFGTLKNILQSDWYSNVDNHVIKMSTGSNNSLWEIFSVYKIPTTGDYLVTDFNNDETYLNFLEFLKNRSELEFDVELTKRDKVLTLSTCYTKSEKVVMHAKLIKTSSRVEPKTE
ncbi:MAG TPA: class B sortase [Candidatus Dojkabacteria bacterium]|nr:class B sortase [Candidatus Dojkabacteria bacterium]